MKIIESIPVLRSLYRSFTLWKFRREWRKRNNHNKTFAASAFPVELVSVGRYTYGMLNIQAYSAPNERLSIGNFVSIAPQVTFLLGGNHQVNTITSYPLYSVFNRVQHAADARTKGPIVIEDEVWIGMGALILSGVTVQKGAIIGAGSVVTRSVPPYAIVGGNPARIITYRFPEDVINELMKINLTDYAESLISERIDLFYKEITSADDVRSFINSLNKSYEKE